MCCADWGVNRHSVFLSEIAVRGARGADKVGTGHFTFSQSSKIVLLKVANSQASENISACVPGAFGL